MVDFTRLIKHMRSAEDGFAAGASRLELPELRLVIDKADMGYYRKDAILTDAEYDILKGVLKGLDETDERLTRVGPPYDPTEIGNKVPHSIPMGSLDNTDDGILGFDPWLENVCDKLGADGATVMATLKVDGGSVCASYKGGKLVRVATRGNGEVGEDITINGARFRNLPTVLSQAIDCEVRGEAILYVSDYKAIRSRDAGIPFDQIPEADRSNPRNIGNGILGRHDGQDSDKIRFLAFNIVGCEVADEAQKWATLYDLGFQPIPFRVCSTSKELHDFYAEIVAKRPDLPFEIDGIVVALFEKAQQDVFITADPKSRLRPKHSRAIKFPHKSNTTVLESVEVTVGHTRMIIPTAKLREVRIGGVNVTSALLNNYTEVQRLGIAIGDEVEVVLAGDIIPKIIRKVKDGVNRTPIVEPSVCPSCAAPTTRTLRGKEGACTYCTSPRCAAAVFAKLDCWIGTSKKGVGILDIGDSMIKALWDNGSLADPADLYTLTVDGLKNVQIGKGVRIGLSRAEKVVANIQSKKNLTLSVFLGSLGIELLGRRRVVLLQEAAAGQLDRLEDWMDIDKLKTIQLAGYGDSIRAAVVQGMEENLELIKKLLANGVSVNRGVSDAFVEAADIEANTPITVGNKPFAGLSFCFTGTREGEDEVIALGGITKSGISKGLDYLVQKDATSQSNKTKKAEQYGTQIIGVDYLQKAIAGEVVLQKASEPVKA